MRPAKSTIDEVNPTTIFHFYLQLEEECDLENIFGDQACPITPRLFKVCLSPFCRVTSRLHDRRIALLACVCGLLFVDVRDKLSHYRRVDEHQGSTSDTLPDQTKY